MFGLQFHRVSDHNSGDVTPEQKLRAHILNPNQEGGREAERAVEREREKKRYRESQSSQQQYRKVS